MTSWWHHYLFHFRCTYILETSLRVGRALQRNWLSLVSAHSTQHTQHTRALHVKIVLFWSQFAWWCFVSRTGHVTAIYRRLIILNSDTHLRDNLVSTWQRTRRFSIPKTEQLILLRGTIFVFIFVKIIWIECSEFLLLSVRLSAWENSAPTREDFHEIWYLRIFWKSVEKVSSSINVWQE
jgi:hypothetical protein